MKLYSEILEVIKSCHHDVEEFYHKGNKSAGKRVRGKMQQLRILAKEFREEIQSIKVAATEKKES
jgi:hypothetical protein